MALYRFEIRNSEDFVQAEPVDLFDRTVVWNEAKRYCGELLQHELQPSGGFRLVVCDEHGAQMLPCPRTWPAPLKTMTWSASSWLRRLMS
jgi:Domain of unknown function (DUF6894)